MHTCPECESRRVARGKLFDALLTVTYIMLAIVVANDLRIFILH